MYSGPFAVVVAGYNIYVLPVPSLFIISMFSGPLPVVVAVYVCHIHAPPHPVLVWMPWFP